MTTRRQKRTDKFGLSQKEFAAVDRIVKATGRSPGHSAIRCPHCGNYRWVGYGPCGHCGKTLYVESV